MEALVHADGRFIWRGQPLRAALGKAGVRVHKEEGDSATPAGLLTLRRVYYRADRIPSPRCTVAIEPIASRDGWCDDPSDRAYNTFVRLPYDAHHEELWRRDALYDLIGVLGWNDQPVVKGLGSAIFLHVAAADYGPTSGCVALALADLTRVLGEGLTAIRVLAG
jgi:L,D-peptidoglycan transpeptidase YkuD (ErfK/YbiS/YcfS/YnhG family)